MQVSSFDYNGICGVEIRIPGAAGGQTLNDWNFPDLPYLRPDRARIKAIQGYTIGSITNSPVSGTPIAPLDIMQRTALTLYGAVDYQDATGAIRRTEGTELIRQIPMLSTNNTRNADVDPLEYHICKLESMSVDWTKSSINVKGGAVGNETDIAFYFRVFYDLVTTIN